MALLGSVAAGSYIVDATSSNIPASGAGPLVLSANQPQDVMSMEIWNQSGAAIQIYSGPDVSLDLICTVPGVASGNITFERQPVKISKGERLTIRAAANTGITTGTVTINLWL